jgi:hypothetical protein
MKLVMTLCTVILAGLAFAATLETTVHCEGGHESECSTECECICCSTPIFTPVDHSSSLKANQSKHAWTSDMPYMGKPSTADIFRPPIS